MNRLNTEDRARLVTLLIEGNSIRATSRISGIAYATCIKFVAPQRCRLTFLPAPRRIPLLTLAAPRDALVRAPAPEAAPGGA